MAYIRQAIADAEKATSGELRIFIDDHCKGDALEKAAFLFSKLGMHQTKLKNGVLIYMSIKDKKFAIIGDSGIHEKVKDEFWQATRNIMQQHFIKGEFVQGLVNGINEAGRMLSQFFPYQSGDTNELSNDIIFGNS